MTKRLWFIKSIVTPTWHWQVMPDGVLCIFKVFFEHLVIKDSARHLLWSSRCIFWLLHHLPRALLLTYRVDDDSLLLLLLLLRGFCVNQVKSPSLFADKHQSLSLTLNLWQAVWVSDVLSESPQFNLSFFFPFFGCGPIIRLQYDSYVGNNSPLFFQQQDKTGY